jgi:hypothetical protein
MMKKILTAILISISFIGNAQLTDDEIMSKRAPKYSNEFLNIGVGARALGMSGSVISSTNDITSGYWNPTGLLDLKELQIGLMHSEYFAGIAKYDFGAIGKAIDSSSAIAVSFVRFGVDDIPNTTELIDAQGNIDYDRITTFSAVDYAFILSYARKISKDFDVGGNAKIVHRKVGNFAKSWGFGLDAAAKYRVGTFTFAAMARDVTTTFNAWSFNLSDKMKDVFVLTGNALPENSIEITLPRLILGAAKDFKISEKFSAITELNLVSTFDGRRYTVIRTSVASFDPMFGFEVDYMKTVFLRGGVGNIQRVTLPGEIQQTYFQPNFGVGLRIKTLQIDYALTNIGSSSIGLNSNVFSLKFDIPKQ